MKTRFLAGVFALLCFATSALAGPRDAEWKEVTEATRHGLPKTAIEKLEPIIAGALADKAYAEAIKAITRKVTIEGQIQGGKAEEKIVRFQAELEKAPAPMKPAMEAILAHWYWQYFEQNRWRFMQRTQMAGSPGTDLQTWDLDHILAEIDRHFTAALANEAVLKSTPIAEYNDLLDRGTVPDNYRPTLFDFLAYDALRFYQAGEQAGTEAEETFEISASGPVFADVKEFANWQAKTNDRASPLLKAIGLYQALLRFHQADVDRSAFNDADLARLAFGNNVAVGENKADRYKAALQHFIDATAGHEISSRALATLAMQFQQEGDSARTHEIAQRGYNAFPKSDGGKMCFNLIQQIEAKSAQLDTEQVWNAPWPTLNITYRNVTKVYFRAVAVKFEDYIRQMQGRADGINRAQLLKLLDEEPALEWNSDLPPTDDYKARTERLPSPTSLEPGFYFIIASHERGFDLKNNQISVAGVWVSELALVMRTRRDAVTQSGIVLRANGGEPVAGATVRLWERERGGYLYPLPSRKTDENGQFEFSAANQSVVVLAENGNQAVSSGREIYCYNDTVSDVADSETVFFTDRAIYRPGQTINYKGVSIRYDHDAGQYSSLAHQSLTVLFNDANGHEVARAVHETNDYGSFSGTFTAPRDRLMGRMTIQVLGGPSMTSFNIEEYKRPKFQVVLNAPVDAAKLDAAVEVIGKATAYTGAALGGAKVKWRVERGVQIPAWCWWWQGSSTKAIAHGSAVTEMDGSFKVQFSAEADHAVPEKNEPAFVFTLHADVTDTTGETRSTDRTVLAGYSALRASLVADDWQTEEKPVTLSIRTNSLDGDPQSASGTVTLYALKQPVAVERMAMQQRAFWSGMRGDDPATDPANPDSWELGNAVVAEPFKTDVTGKEEVTLSLKAGIYRASLETTDRFGKKVTARQTVQVLNPADRHYGVKLANQFSSPKWSVEPGETFTALWGTGYDTGRAFVELECDGKPLKSFWTAPDRTQQLVEQTATENMRGGFTVRVTYVRENRAYITERTVDVPWSNKELTVKWESFRSKLEPGKKETWTAVVTGPDAKRTAAEMVVTLYDASLDQFLPNNWPQAFNVFRRERSHVDSEFRNTQVNFGSFYNWSNLSQRNSNWRYRAFPAEIIAEGGEEDMIVLSPFVVESREDVGAYMANSTLAGTRIRTDLKDVASSVTVATKAFLKETGASNSESLLNYTQRIEIAGVDGAFVIPRDLNKITARKNIDETAFFFPTLIAGDDGVVKMVFTMPEALTEWKFLGFAHDRQLRAGFLTGKAVTTKDLMVEPNPPRFLREGDAIEFTVKVSNQTDQSQTGTVRLTFADAESQKSVDGLLGNRVTEQPFDIPAKQSRSYSWKIAVPDGTNFLTYKAVAASAKFSDGEEGFLPVLSRRVLVTESLPLPIRGQTTKQFEFKKLLASGASDTLRQESLTVQMVSHPAWYAVMALPYLMEYPYECSEQVFNRLYANALARRIANSDPKIRQVFELWKNTPALNSPLQKNQDLKSVMLEETPWVREAQSESQARRNVGLLFDSNRLDEETARALHTLADRQLSDGLWSWFPGGASSEYISLYIMTGFGRLRHLGVDLDPEPAIKSLTGLDEWMDNNYRRIRNSNKPEEYVPSSSDALYLYGRSFFLSDQPVSAAHQPAIDFFLRQSRKFWLQVNSRQSQAHLALALQRFGDKETPLAILKSLKERSIEDEELGMFWRDVGPSWWWYEAPIETEAMMIEAFAEVTHDTQAVEDCKVWLLKQKQTQDWRTTKATADAVYGLLLNGSDLLASNEQVEVSLAGEAIKPDKIEAGTGFYERKFIHAEIKPAMGHVTVKKVDQGVSWGSVSWQYLEDIAKITPHEGTPLKLKKTLFIKDTTAKGQMLKPVTGPVSVGDELVVRIELCTDRDMEFVHLKDQRGSGTEPVNVLSEYKYQDGLAYYETTRDTASHFFIDYLPKGVYVFEYSVRVQLKGQYQTGLAEIQCMYAPEFNSHSESIPLTVN